MLYHPVLIKSTGTCKPGERADLTGCTPASDESSGKPQPKQQSPANITTRLHSSIDANKLLSPEQKTAYKQAMTEATASIPPKAMDRISSHLKGEHFYADSDALAEGIAKSSVEAATAGKQVLPEVIKLAVEQLKEKNIKDKVGGSYITGNQTMHLAGAGRTGELTVNATGIYAHELTHAIDGPNFELSNSEEFGMAYALEIWGTSGEPKLTRYAWNDHKEGFAEFGRLLYSPGVDLKAVMKKFPNTSKYFKSQGLWPKGAK